MEMMGSGVGFCFNWQDKSSHGLVELTSDVFGDNHELNSRMVDSVGGNVCICLDKIVKATVGNTRVILHFLQRLPSCTPF